MTLTAHGSEALSVFGLLKTDENSATYALGWALDRSLSLRQLFVDSIFGKPQDVTESVIALQKHNADGGYTDLEAWAADRWHIVLKAKCGWEVPSAAQLSRYSP